VEIGTLSKDVVSNLIADIVFALVAFLYHRSRASLERVNPFLRQGTFFALFLLYTVLNIVFFKFIQTGYTAFLPISTLILAVFVWHELNQYWAVGLVGADREIKTGIDPRQSLKLCRNSLDFLGIGATKLVRNRVEFENAIERCQRPDQPVRFLLCSPDQERLEQIARNANRSKKEYQDAVRESLTFIAKLRRDRAFNIEVRLYSELPIFRVMFVDDTLCLASHYVFGEGDGSHLPQLHVRKAARGGREVDSLYYAFRVYFLRAWDAATPLNYEDYIQ
jgi:hypothetical protein